jgi:hypothetical protein
MKAFRIAVYTLKSPTMVREDVIVVSDDLANDKTVNYYIDCLRAKFPSSAGYRIIYSECTVAPD